MLNIQEVYVILEVVVQTWGVCGTYPGEVRLSVNEHLVTNVSHSDELYLSAVVVPHVCYI